MVRTILLIALLFSADAFADPLRVVILSRDHLVVEYRCSNAPERAEQSAPATRSIVRQQGYVRWHIRGGVPPYTVIESEHLRNGRFHVTVMDAEGHLATASGLYNTFVDVVAVECPTTAPDAEFGPGAGPKDHGQYTRRIDRYAANDGRYRSPAAPRPRDPSTTRNKPGPTSAGDGPRVTYGGASSKGPDSPTGTTGYRQAIGK